MGVDGLTDPPNMPDEDSPEEGLTEAPAEEGDDQAAGVGVPSPHVTEDDLEDAPEPSPEDEDDGA